MTDNEVITEAINELCDADKATTLEGRQLRSNMTIESVQFLAE